MKGLIEAGLGRARTVLLVLALILVSGVVTYSGIPKESDPDIDIPIIYVTMSHDGISPEDAERLLIRPMEQELRSIGGIKEMRATAQEGFASVLLEFEAGFDKDRALADVRERVDLVKPDLPDETDEPIVNEVNVSLFPVLVVALAGDVPERTLIRLARDLRDRIQELGGVLEAKIVGDREEVMEVVIDPKLMESYNVSSEAIYSIVNRSNTLIPAGALDTGRGRFAVKVPGLFRSAADVFGIPIKVSGDGVVTLGDIATIRPTFKDPETIARVNGKPAIAIEVSKRIGENVIDTIEAVRAVVAERSAAWPGGVEVSYFQDKSKTIRTLLADLQNNVLSAVLLVMIVVVAVLGVRGAGLVGLAIPSSFLIGILTLAMLGLTLNIVVLFSLILAVGMLVDGAIIVTEYADRKMAEGAPRRAAYGEAAKRMAWPITASTATTVAAFMPLLFWPGVVGQFMKFLPITLVATLTGSLLMALLFVPVLGSLIGRPGVADADTARALGARRADDLADLRGATGTYVRMLRFLGHHPGKVVLAAAVVLVGVYVYYARHGNGIEFFPEVEPDNAVAQVHARGNLSVWEKHALMREVEAVMLDVPGFATVYTRTGFAGQEAAEDVIGTIQLEFEEWRTRRPASEILASVRERANAIAGINVEIRKEEGGPPVGKPIQVEISGASPEAIEAAAVRLRSHLEQMEGLVDVEDSRPIPGIEWQIVVDRAQAGRFGTDMLVIGNAIQMITNGVKIDTYRPDDSDDEVEIRARFPQTDRGILQLDSVRVPTAQGQVPLGNFVTRVAKPTVGTIHRTDARRVLTVKADVAEGVLADTKLGELRAWLAENDLGPGISLKFKGQDQEQQQAATFLTQAFSVALFVMAIILVTQFNSFYNAFLILSAVVLSTVGVILGLIVSGQPFGIVMTGVGIVALAGIVVNNNIVLIDTYADMRRSGIGAYDAVILTGAQRLRPVLLTTVTTVLGLVPMVAGLNIDFFAREIAVGAPSTQWWTQLSTAIVSGLSFATVLTLVVTPCLLLIGARMGARTYGRRRGAAAVAAPAE